MRRDINGGGYRCVVLFSSPRRHVAHIPTESGTAGNARNPKFDGHLAHHFRGRQRDDSGVVRGLALTVVRGD